MEGPRVRPEVRAEVLGQEAKLGAIEAPRSARPAEAAAVKAAVGEAFVAGFRWVMGVAAGLALASIAWAWLCLRR